MMITTDNIMAHDDDDDHESMIIKNMQTERKLDLKKEILEIDKEKEEKLM